MNEERSKVNYGAKALLPIGVFMALFVIPGVVFTFMGVEKPFNVMPRYVAVMAGILTAFFCFDREKKVADKAEIYYKGAGATGAMTFALVVLLAGGFAGSCAAIGGKDSMVNLGVSLIPSQFLIPGIFAMCAIISTCIGSCMGTVSVMGPIAVALAQGAGLNLAMTAAAVLTGSTFGDNLSMISDTTISSTKGVGADMKDKFRMNFKIAIPGAILTVILYAVLSMNGNGVTAPEIGDYNIITIIPYIAVLALALVGLDVIIVLAIGMGLSCVIGLLVGTASFFEWAQGVSSGMEGMFWVCVFVMMVSGLIGMIRYYGGLDWLLEKARGAIRSSRSCEYVILLFPLVLAAIIVNNTLSIIISAPLVKELGEKYRIEPRRMASLLDIGACIGPMLMPHGTLMLMIQENSGCGYFDIVRYELYPFLLLIAALITIHFGIMVPKRQEGQS